MVDVPKWCNNKFPICFCVSWSKLADFPYWRNIGGWSSIHRRECKGLFLACIRTIRIPIMDHSPTSYPLGCTSQYIPLSTIVGVIPYIYSPYTWPCHYIPMLVNSNEYQLIFYFIYIDSYIYNIYYIIYTYSPHMFPTYMFPIYFLNPMVSWPRHWLHR